jgi:hypothetical protein
LAKEAGMVPVNSFLPHQIAWRFGRAMPISGLRLLSNTGYCIEEQTGQRNEEQKTEK